MVTEAQIDYILETYALPQKMLQRVRTITFALQNKGAFSSFEDVYHYIGELVEKFQLPYCEKVAQRLNREVGFKIKMQRIFHPVCDWWQSFAQQSLS